ncbi:glycosyltransferase family A protein [Rhodoplanes sp. TEM]|uniref:Glycosyltransferase family A protein n=1 Tax=Rhodoplanes tepidamans TaxID=200616 RepID=A0ABT5JAZ2_RHOTP|nr:MULTISPECIES: glycosyltransferase family A protein [Rhodoplanes]MDC7786855.1 glycosyltransferase family A protein [Rhodoplanes tepidamans]MDC7984216.1 glycosyltransferase family A protein [Rhodoplanes sp. TEM]MDQ0355983.1 glycosyltransferase involved in cell wall biosynthesis [Rhodoplanes tepidamans]
MQLSLPLVSVVVTSYNFARFLTEAVASVHAQAYPAIECIVVDDASSDDTAAVLDAVAAEWPATTVIRRETNGGQGAACRTGYEASRGPYVVFMDGDDVMGPDFVATHVYVQLSSRIHVGITSSDIYQVVDGQVVLGTCQGVNDHIVAHAGNGAGLFRPVEPAPAGPWTLDTPGPALLDRLVHVPPGQVHWCWSHHSANMYRRDAVDLFVRSDEFSAMRICLDAFLCTAVGHRCGGVLIDRPLSLHRVHGGNAGIRQAQLVNVRAAPPDKELSTVALMRLVELYVREAATVVPQLWNAGTYTALVDRLDAHLTGLGHPGVLAAAMARHHATLVQALGQDELTGWMERRATGGRKRRWSRPWRKRARG